MSEEKKASEQGKISRRRYLEVTGGAIAGLVVGGALGYVAKPTVTAPPEMVTETATTTVTAQSTLTAATSAASQVTHPWDLAIAQMNNDLASLIDTANDNARESSIDWTKHSGETVHQLAIADTTDYDVRMNAAAQKFKELTGINVIIDFGTPDEVRQKSILALQSKSPAYDIVYGFMDLIPAWGPNGIDAMEPLDTFMNDPTLYDAKWFDLEDLNQPMINYLRVNGKLYSLFDMLEIMWLNYRKDLFQKYGVTSIPDTYEDLYKAAGLCNHPPDVYGNVSRGAPTSDTLGTACCWVFSYGGDWFGPDWKPTFNQGGALDGLDMYTKILKDYGPPGEATWNWQDEKQFTMLGKAATNVCSFWRALTFWSTQLGTSPDVVGNIWFAPPPKGPKYRANEAWANGAPINKYSQHKEAAWLWYVYKYSRPVMAYNCATSIAWARNSIYDIPSVAGVEKTLDDYGIHIKKALSTLYPWFTVPIPEWAQVGTLIGAAISSTLAGQQTIKQALDDAANKALKIMTDAGYYKPGVAPYTHPPPSVTD
jgi:ABC-type glycerol-3-phosphate transport system substrate-binding protein